MTWDDFGDCIEHSRQCAILLQISQHFVQSANIQKFPSQDEAGDQVKDKSSCATLFCGMPQVVSIAVEGNLQGREGTSKGTGTV